AKRVVASDFRRADPAKAEVILVEGADRILLSFPQELSDAGQRSLESLGVEVRLNTRVLSIDENGIETDKGRIESSTVVWGAGVKPGPVAEWLGAEADRGRVKVQPDLSVPGHPEIFVIGDCAYLEQDGK